MKKQTLPDAVLFATVGTNDLQVVVEREGNAVRAEVARGLRAWHEAMLDGRLGYVVDASRVGLSRADGGLTFDAKSTTFSEEVVTDGEKIVLVPAKLAEVARSLASKYRVRAAVVFATRRERGVPKTEGEPVAAGRILSAWLASEFALKAGVNVGELGDGIAGWVDILRGREQTDGTGRDDATHDAAVARIDAVVREASRWWKDPSACVSPGGGMGEFKEPLVACVRYRFGHGRAWVEQASQLASGGSAVWSSAEPTPTPMESFRAREHATQLIEAGDFTGAAGVVSHLLGTREAAWARPVIEVAWYLMGRGALGTVTDARPYLQPLVDGGAPRCLLSAVRAEAALRGGRIPEAIAWTCTFFDAALLDFMEKKLCARRDDLDDLESKITIQPAAMPPPTSPLWHKGCLKDLNPPVPSSYRYNTNGKRGEWLGFLGVVALNEYNTALEHPTHGRKPRQLRNANTHALLLPAEMRRVEDVFVHAGLWNMAGAGAGGGRLLWPRSPANKVLEALGVSAPAGLYPGLVEDLRQDLADHGVGR